MGPAELARASRQRLVRPDTRMFEPPLRFPLSFVPFRWRARLAYHVVRARVAAAATQERVEVLLVTSGLQWFFRSVMRELVDEGTHDVHANPPRPDLFPGTVFDMADPANTSFLARRRAQFVEEQVEPALYGALAVAWKKGSLAATNLSMLPVLEDGKGDKYRFAGPQMQQEHVLVMFVLIHVLGVSPFEAAAIGKRIVNEWHDLDPATGLDAAERSLLRMPENPDGEKEPV